MKSIAQGDIISASFDALHTVYLTGASFDQLYRWRKEGLIEAEFDGLERPYSYRDLVIYRLAAFLRSQHPMKVVRETITSIDREDLNCHPSTYQVRVKDSSLLVADSFRPFTNLSGRHVRDLEQPFEFITSDPERIGGWPSFNKSRINYDFLANAFRIDEAGSDRHLRNYPYVPGEAIVQAHAMRDEVRRLKSSRAHGEE